MQHPTSFLLLIIRNSNEYVAPKARDRPVVAVVDRSDVSVISERASQRQADCQRLDGMDVPVGGGGAGGLKCQS